MVTLKQLQYGAAAIALGCSLGLTANAGAQIVETDTMDVTVQIESTFDLTVVDDINMGVLSLFTTNGGTDPTAIISTAGVVSIGVNDTSNFFYIVDNTDQQEGTVTIEGALPTETINITIPTADVVGPTLNTDVLAITNAVILETSPSNATANGNVSTTDLTMPIVTDGSGEAAFSIGITLTADADNATQYADGVYTGEMVINAAY